MCFLALFETPLQVERIGSLPKPRDRDMFPTKIMFQNRLLCIAAKVSILYQGSTGVFVRKWPTCLLPRRIQIQASLPYTWSGAYPMYRYIGYFLFSVFILSFYSVFYSTFSNIVVNEIIVTLSQLLASNIRLMHQVLLLDARWVRSCTLSLIIISHYRFSLSFLSL